MWNDYDEEDLDSEYNLDNWEVRLNNETIDVFETKEDALYGIFDEIEQITDFYEKLESLGYCDEEELHHELMDMCASDFYNELNKILKKLKISDSFKLINLDNEEPEFGEL